MTQLEVVLERIDEGACIDAFVNGEPVISADLAPEERWPAYAPARANSGSARCSVSQRLTLEDVMAALLLVDGRGWVEQFPNR